MPTIGNTLSRVADVIAARLNRRPILPHHKLTTNPPAGLGFSTNGVKSLSGRLETEFQAENLELSPREIGVIAPTTVNDLAKAVFDRTKPMPRPKVSKIVIGAVEGVLGPNAGPVTEATKLRDGGLDLSEKEIGDFARELRTVFFTTMRLEYSSEDAKEAVRVRDWIKDIRAQFSNQNR